MLLQNIKDNLWLYLCIILIVFGIIILGGCTTTERKIYITCSGRDIYSPQDNRIDMFCDQWIDATEFLEFVENQKCVEDNEECRVILDGQVLDGILEIEYLKDLYLNDIK